jgi:hypothetical protein
MSYQTQAGLAADSDFNGRSQAAAVQQADYFKDNPEADQAALAASVLRADLEVMSAFVRMNAAGPGIAEKVDTGAGIDQALVLDADLLALTQANWPVVAALFYAPDGTPL